MGTKQIKAKQIKFCDICRKEEGLITYDLVKVERSM